MLRIQDLKPTDEVQLWMRPGFALKLGRTVKGKTYRYVPAYSTVSKQGDLSHCRGRVVANNPDNQTLSLTVQPCTPNGDPTGYSTQVEISYTKFRYLRKYSEYSYEPRKGNSKRPTEGPYNSFRPYRTIEPVLIA